MCPFSDGGYHDPSLALVPSLPLRSQKESLPTLTDGGLECSLSGAIFGDENVFKSLFNLQVSIFTSQLLSEKSWEGIFSLVN